jgi:hypothetical protein
MPQSKSKPSSSPDHVSDVSVSDVDFLKSIGFVPGEHSTNAPEFRPHRDRIKAICNRMKEG